MTAATRICWQDATTLDDLGELTAVWLEGRIPEHPGYGEHPDPETAELIPALAAINRNGLVTISSQPGMRDVALDGAALVQRAEVSGFTTEAMLRRIWAARPEGLRVTYHRGSMLRCPLCRLRCPLCRLPTAVTLCDGEPCTWSGVHLSRSEIRLQFEPCRKTTRGKLYRAWQVSVMDREWGRNDVLWPWLERLANEQEEP